MDPAPCLRLYSPDRPCIRCVAPFSHITDACSCLPPPLIFTCSYDIPDLDKKRELHEQIRTANEEIADALNIKVFNRKQAEATGETIARQLHGWKTQVYMELGIYTGEHIRMYYNVNLYELPPHMLVLP